MAPPQQAIKCRKCSNTKLVKGFTLGESNALFMVGGTGQQPATVGSQWAAYLCPKCRYIGIYDRHYAALSNIQQEYADIVKMLDKNWEDQRQANSLLSQIEDIIEANKTFVSIPSDNKLDVTISRVLENKLSNINTKIDAFESELKKRRGGRPKKNKTI